MHCIHLGIENGWGEGRKKQACPYRDPVRIQWEHEPGALSTRLHHAYDVLSTFSALDVSELISSSQQVHEAGAVFIIIPILQLRKLSTGKWNNLSKGTQVVNRAAGSKQGSFGQSDSEASALQGPVCCHPVRSPQVSQDYFSFPA